MSLSADSARIPSPASTGLLVSGILVTSWTIPLDLPSAMSRHAAQGLLLSIALAMAVELRQSWRNLFRPDLMGLLSLYFLTFFEFLFPQPEFDKRITSETVRPALSVCLWAFAAYALSRHVAPQIKFRSALWTTPIPARFLIVVFCACALIGYFHMLSAVDFSIPRMFEAFMGPRFSQPWGRGRFGDWKALLYELGMLLFLLPPLAGVILARRSKHSPTGIMIVAVILSVTFFYGFSTGTRNLFASYLVTFLIGYAFAAPKERVKEVLLVTACAAFLLLVSTQWMLDFRNIGLRNYLKQEQVVFLSTEDVFVDYNLYVIAELVDSFPSEHSFRGAEIPWLALIRPIPRAIWPGKPEGMSVSMEEVLGVEGLTVASTYIGEAYMTNGLLGVVAASFFFGIVATCWSRLAQRDLSDFGIFVYASGLFAIVVSMRSMLVFTTAILPTVAAIFIGRYFITHGTAAIPPVPDEQGSVDPDPSPRGDRPDTSGAQ